MRPGWVGRNLQKDLGLRCLLLKIRQDLLDAGTCVVPGDFPIVCLSVVRIILPLLGSGRASEHLLEPYQSVYISACDRHNRGSVVELEAPLAIEVSSGIRIFSVFHSS